MGPALIVCFVVVLGFSIRTAASVTCAQALPQFAAAICASEFKADMKAMEDRLTHLINTRIDALRDLLKSEVKRPDERIDQSTRLIAK